MFSNKKILNYQIFPRSTLDSNGHLFDTILLNILNIFNMFLEWKHIELGL